MPKSAILTGIKSLRCYTVQEAAEITGVTARTIRIWIKDGLAAMDEERPKLIRGEDLTAFIKSQRKARKAFVGADQFYCLRCRAARPAADGFVECQSQGTRARLTAICDACHAIMTKPVASSRLPELRQMLDLVEVD